MEIAEVRAIVQRALADKMLTRAEQQEIMNAVLADGKVSPEEQELLKTILDDISKGIIRAVD